MRNCGPEWLRKCLKCGHNWLALVVNPVRCPKCQTYRWNREKIPPGRKPEFDIRVMPGHNKLFQWSNDDVKDFRLNRAIYAAQRKNPRLMVQARADGVLLSWPIL